MLSASRAGHLGAGHPKGEQANEGHTGPSSRDWGLTQQSLTEWEKERPLWDMCILSELLAGGGGGSVMYALRMGHPCSALVFPAW